MKKMKFRTIEQYYIYEWIKKNFYIQYLLDIEIVTSKSIKITDINSESMLITYENEKVRYEFV